MDSMMISGSYNNWYFGQADAVTYNACQVRKGHSFITQKDIIDVLDKQLLEGMGVLLTEEEQQKCEASVCNLFLSKTQTEICRFQVSLFCSDKCSSLV